MRRYDPAMGTVYRFKVALSGWIGGPGVNTWHMCQAEELGGASQSDLEGMAVAIKNVYAAVATYFPSGIAAEVQSVVEGFDIATGNLLSVTGIDTPVPVGGSSGQNATSRATQITVRLQTDALRGNRQLQGRHFIGPVSSAALGADGQVPGDVRSAVQSAYGGVTDILGDGRLVVWGQPNPLHDREDARAGRIGYVQSVLANATPGSLRSRKV